MIIGIEAQRIFRKNKHGMDYVVLQEIKELQQIDTENEYYVFVKPGEDRCVESTKNVHIIELTMGATKGCKEIWRRDTTLYKQHSSHLV